MNGRHHTEESKQKIRIAFLGKKRPDWHKEKMRKPRGKYGYHPHFKIRGENNPSWKGGITPLTIVIRNCFKYRQWRSDVFSRDDFTCTMCYSRGGWIEADHYPLSFAEIFHKNKIESLSQALQCEEFWNINNGRTLCKRCHYKVTHKKL